MVRGSQPKWNSEKEVLRLEDMRAGTSPVFPVKMGRSVLGDRPVNRLALRGLEEWILHGRWLCGWISWIFLANSCMTFSGIPGRKDP